MNTDVRNAVLRGVGGASETHDAFRLRDKHEDGSRPIDVFGAISDLEIPLNFEPLDNLLGACVRVDSASVGILITTQRSLHMQRFTAAHELGHFVLEHEGSLDREVRNPGDTKDRPIVEVEADAFAAEFLMPKWLVRATAERRGWWSAECLNDANVIYQLSLRLSMSYEATCWGLVANEFIRAKAAEAISDKKPKELKQRALKGVPLPDPWADVWMLGEGDDGAHLDAGPNDIFVVELHEDAAAGFRWDVNEAEAAHFRVLDDGSSFSERRVGSASMRRLVFAAPPEGMHELHLNHHRSFAKRSGSKAISLSISTRGATKRGSFEPLPSASIH